ncbi:thioredoxin reductase [Anaplasma marginale str. Dawn]|uniref:Thioredoxin reductase n=3 Tax=Anaplasma marginale TaxID=770 RepID=B9KID2_ANAMF|nr:thioredoxin-disulfide reductase [Anaplasma marginale]AAV86538.1 thioredoxin reductase [Anaplasma marginale str. St. Maries]ACM49244.1 thioredoxin reductase (trxB) [Anaplasma marginale str. Florida]AGZ78789.1 thioredoxin reductase [Anaplasma marginale str. Gypsy Plains]AGZ79622.1 thioredoxin reductase [Anaplasma marginale str. Dawn]AXW83988.1 thioredoxin-disulfide reductase [Anaplasma marginale]
MTEPQQQAKAPVKVLVMGSGAAGCTAAIYAGRANLEPLLVTGMQPGGQLTITTDVENYPGFSLVQGPELMEHMKQQALHCGATEIMDEITQIDANVYPFKCTSMFGEEYYAYSIIVATGAQAKWLGMDSEQFFMGKGVSACATCDGSFFKGEVVAVIGGGNTAVEEAIYLTRSASKVFLVHRRDKLRAEAVMQNRLFENSKIEVVWNSVVKEILGDKENKKVGALLLESTLDGSTRTLETAGVFIAIGHKPNTQVLADMPGRHVELDPDGYVITSPDSTATSCPGIFAAGDVRDKVYRQAVVAAGTGCMAALDAEKFLSERGITS